MTNRSKARQLILETADSLSRISDAPKIAEMLRVVSYLRKVADDLEEEVLQAYCDVNKANISPFGGNS